MSVVYFGHDFYKIEFTVFVTKFKLKILIKRREQERSCKNHVKVVFCIVSMHTF